MSTTSSVNVKDIEKLFEAGLHLGHKKNRLHPKARRFVYTIDKGVSIIDLTSTLNQINAAKKVLAEAASDGKTLLVVATKKVASQYANEICKKHGVPHITVKWPSGLLTNFQTIIKNVKKLSELKELRDGEDGAKMIKHERVRLTKHISKLEKFYGGLVPLSKKPDFLFIVDIKKEKNATGEARQTHIPVVAIADTNADPGSVAYPIVANDDSPASVEFLITTIVEAYAGGLKAATKSDKSQSKSSSTEANGEKKPKAK